jgi:hypothetical protein
VLVVATLGAERRRRFRRRMRTAAPEPAATPVTVGRATLIDARPLTGDPQAWLSGADCEAEALAGLAVVNAVLQRQRIVAADPAAHGIAPGQALVLRVGVGAGEEVASGRWSSAVEVVLGTGRRRREAVLSPQERLAAVLSGRDVILACEELALRARADVDAGRWREAAFQLDCALRAAVAELASWAGQGDLDERITLLAQATEQTAEAARTALIGGLSAEQIAALEESLLRLEAALRARAAIAR